MLLIKVLGSLLERAFALVKRYIATPANAVEVKIPLQSEGDETILVYVSKRRQKRKDKR